MLLLSNTDLVVIFHKDQVSVLYGRCLHRGALLSDGRLEGNNLICGVHDWDYRFDTDISEYAPSEQLHKFTHAIHNEAVFVDLEEVKTFEDTELPSRFNREQYLGEYADTHPEATEPYTSYISEFARNGLKNYGHHGPTAAMGVDRTTLPS